MISKVYSCSCSGLECNIIEVQADISQGLSSFAIVGMGDISVQESKERIRSSIKNSGFSYPQNKKTINLAPAKLKKQGTLFDLPIALSLLLASEQIKIQNANENIFIGELSLNGQIRPVDGILPITQYAKSKGFKNIYLPKDNSLEASFIDNINIFPIENLKQLVSFFRNEITIEKTSYNPIHVTNRLENNTNLFSQIIGHEKAKRALMIAASGHHNILLSGSPGCGKTVLSRAFQELLPEMTEEEIMETTKIYSIAGLLDRDNPIIIRRPFREVHHTASNISIIGGGGILPKPGEISLAHNGILFLDEITEFTSQTLEALRQPLEDRFIHINRANFSAKFPSKFILVATMNPCRCGYLHDKKIRCICTESQIKNYQKKLSGPILDRFDIFLDIEKVALNNFFDEKFEQNEIAKNQIIKLIRSSKLIQQKRFHKYQGIHANADMELPQIREFCKLDKTSEQLLKQASDKLNLSNRGYLRTLKIARTIADLENSENINSSHIAEAIQYREQR